MIGTIFALGIFAACLIGIAYTLFAIDAEDMFTFGGLAAPLATIAVLALIAIIAFSFAIPSPASSTNYISETSYDR